MDETPANPVKVLLIDDDPALLNLMQLGLAAEGYSVRTASNGSEGMKLLEQELPDIVITDLVMPEQEGLETIIHLRKHYPGLRIIAISAGINEGTIDMLPAALKLGARQTLRKPFSIEALLKATGDVLAE